MKSLNLNVNKNRSPFLFTIKFLETRAVGFSHCNSGPERRLVVLVKILAQMNKAIAVVPALQSWIVPWDYIIKEGQQNTVFW